MFLLESFMITWLSDGDLEQGRGSLRFPRVPVLKWNDHPILKISLWKILCEITELK